VKSRSRLASFIGCLALLLISGCDLLLRSPEVRWVDAVNEAFSTLPDWATSHKIEDGRLIVEGDRAYLQLPGEYEDFVLSFTFEVIEPESDDDFDIGIHARDNGLMYYTTCT